MVDNEYGKLDEGRKGNYLEFCTNRFPTARCQQRRISDFTLIELCMVIAIIVILMCILLPALQSVRESAKGMVCLNNLKEMNLAFVNYLNDNNEFYMGHNNDPSGQIWCYKLLLYIDSNPPAGDNSTYSGIFICPNDKTPQHINILDKVPDYIDTSYGYNAGYPNAASNQWYGLKVSNVKNPSDKVLVADSTVYYQVVSSTIAYRPYRHRSGDNFLWADGHASWNHINHPPATYEYFRATY